MARPTTISTTLTFTAGPAEAAGSELEEGGAGDGQSELPEPAAGQESGAVAGGAGHQ